MKPSGSCPKCQSKDLVRIPGRFGQHGSGNNIPVGFWSAVMVTRFLCSACGFSEEWVESATDRRKISKAFGDK